MNKLIKTLVITEICLGLVLFVALNIQFSTDVVVKEMLENKDAFSSLHRLVVYFIPGVMVLCPLFMVVFDSKILLLLMAILNLYSTTLLFQYVGNSSFINTCAILSTICAVIYSLIVIKFIFTKKKSR